MFRCLLSRSGRNRSLETLIYVRDRRNLNIVKMGS